MSGTHGKSSDHHSHAPPPPPEPKTPMWLPALGAVLFLTLGLLWGLMPGEGASGTTAPSPASSANK